MDITSPNSLWKDYDVTALPLNGSELSNKTADGLRVREFYFDGFTTFDGKARAFIRIYENTGKKGVILYMPDVSGADDDPTIKEYCARGFTVAVLDYAGKRDTPRFTIYPASLASCNCSSAEKFSAPNDALNSCWYVWTCIARRAARLLKEIYPKENLFALGKGLGGSTVYKLGAFDDGIVACATLLNINPSITGAGNQMINYRAALDNNAYAPIINTPIFMSVCSNARDNSLDKMSELAQVTAGKKCFRIVERAFDDGIRVVYDQLERFYADIASGNAVIPQITIKPVNSENNLYYNITVKFEDKEVEIKRADFYAAFGTRIATYRNWTNIKLLNIGGGEYMANPAVLQEDKYAYVFINLFDLYDNVFSAPILSVVPKSMGIHPQQAVKRRLIYEGSMGKDVWMAPGGDEVELRDGPFGIAGVSAKGNKLITFKPGDFLYHAKSDALLQLLISGEAKTLRVTVSDGNESYICDLDMYDKNGWNKFTVSLNDFKSAGGVLPDWSDIIFFKFEADSDFIISSVLWV